MKNWSLKFFTLSICSTLVLSSCGPAPEAALQEPEQEAGPRTILIDDMLIDEDSLLTRQSDGTWSEGLQAQGASGFASYGSMAWTDGVIPITFVGVTEEQKPMIWDACRKWGSTAKISCRARKKTDKKYLVVRTDQSGCYATVGAGRASGYRTMNLGTGCWYPQVVLHELGHVLGFMHEHQRPDRDNYLTVISGEAPPEKANNFSILSRMDHSGAYDFLSIMHYYATAFSTTGRPTLVAKPGYETYQAQMGRGMDLSSRDHQVARKIYGKK